MSNAERKSLLARLESRFEGHREQLQAILFTVFSFFAFLSQVATRLICDLAFKGLDSIVNIWPFPAQALGSFLAFLISNIVAKLISFIMNRKKTFNANNNALFSIVSYIVMVTVLIVVETIIGTPLQNSLYTLFGGAFTGAELTTASALNGSLYQLTGTFSLMIYGIADMIIVFVMDKYVIMRRKDANGEDEQISS